MLFNNVVPSDYCEQTRWWRFTTLDGTVPALVLPWQPLWHYITQDVYHIRWHLSQTMENNSWRWYFCTHDWASALIIVLNLSRWCLILMMMLQISRVFSLLNHPQWHFNTHRDTQSAPKLYLTTDHGIVSIAMALCNNGSPEIKAFSNTQQYFITRYGLKPGCVVVLLV